MKKILFLLFPLIIGCTSGDKKPGTVLVTPAVDTTKIIDTTIFEDGIAPVSEEVTARVGAKGKKEKKEKVSCGFGFKKFNTRKRPIEEAPGGVRGKPPRKGTEPPLPPPPPDGTNNVIFLNYFGKTVANTMWNVSGPIDVGDAGLGQPEIDYISAEVRSHYPDYNVTITLDKDIFDAAAVGHKVEIVITESWEWYGMAGGVAYINSFFWTDGTPAFVFSTLLNYNSHNIAEAAAHEAGHTLGLRHQSDCENGAVINQYSVGKTMGNGYSSFPISPWWNGTSSAFCAMQDDKAILAASLGLKQTP